MSYPSDLDHCFPIDQLTEYKYSVEELEPWALLEVVKFDIEFRGILLSALSIVELALVTKSANLASQGNSTHLVRLVAPTVRYLFVPSRELQRN